MRFLVLILFFLVACDEPAEVVQVEDPVDHKVFEIYGCDHIDPDPLPVSDISKMKDPQSFPTKEHLKTIGRMARGIVLMKDGMYWECGRVLTEKEDIQDLAIKYAFEIVRAAYEVSDRGDDPDFILNPWGLAGTIQNESGFDRCALGPHPRNSAYELGILKKKRRSISHTEAEILKVVTHPKMQALYARSGFDLGTAQLLSRFYEDPKDYKNMLSLRGSTVEAARSMRDRSRTCQTEFPDRPWRCWPGRDSERYDARVSRWALELGCGPEGI